MNKKHSVPSRIVRIIPAFLIILLFMHVSYAKGQTNKPDQPPIPVRPAFVQEKTVAEQVSLIGSTEPIAQSMVASEVSGVVEYFPVRAGDFVNKGDVLVRLRATELKLRLKAAKAAGERVRVNLENAEKELARADRLKVADTISEKKYDEALYRHRALLQELLEKEAETEQLKEQVIQKTVTAPFSGFVAQEHTQVGEWIDSGGAVVTLLDMSTIRITVDVPERYSVMLTPGDEVWVTIKSVSETGLSGKIHAILPQGNAASRTFPVRINLPNPEQRLKSGMEARVAFGFGDKKSTLLVPKDAVNTSGSSKLVYVVNNGRALPVDVTILGYYDGNAAIQGDLRPGDIVVVRGNERLRPGQKVRLVE